MNLAELISSQKGDRSYDQLERDCGGRPSSKRLQQIVTGQLKAFPDPDSIRSLARGLRVSEAAVVLAAAESLGLDVRRALPALVEILPAEASDLSEREALAVAELIRAFKRVQVVHGVAGSGKSAAMASGSYQRGTPLSPVEDVDAVTAGDTPTEDRADGEEPMAARRGESRGRQLRREQDEAGETSPGGGA